MADVPAFDPAEVRLVLRIEFGGSFRLGPGKAELLERIRETGSIAAAGRLMTMSYKRAWMLVEEMNAAFQEPLVDSTRGGQNGGGARVTTAGDAVLARYRGLEALVLRQGADDLAALVADLRDVSAPK